MTGLRSEPSGWRYDRKYTMSYRNPYKGAEQTTGFTVCIGYQDYDILKSYGLVDYQFWMAVDCRSDWVNISCCRYSRSIRRLWGITG